ncbi:Alpha/Beta hydrolase protein [Zychaea mexicana]|uniref:Alpha/Beta hydrolase protein n=1 Tax=Zychaea mexicana TaxID=64656 RepID=UPI0022FE040F|nr:Alpha/Beta hydrolase protein [Zychaea mexicana]KAI9493368.1 Alpha/Beta hydrolase protein [Zychaea mexicana]
MSSTIEPFEIPSIPAERLALLRQKLQKAEYPNELEKDVGWEYGAPRWAVEPLVKAWLNDYDWEKARAEMNSWHHYDAMIQGLHVHFIHEPSTVPDAIPLLLMNGWPSTFYEYHKIVESLRNGANGGFSCRYSSLPGYGFSEASKVPGYGVAKNGEMMDELMATLGYTQYMLSGSDWGSNIGNWMARNCSDRCKEFHSVMPLCLPSSPTNTLSLLWTHPLHVIKYYASIILGIEAVYGNGFEAEELAFAGVQSDPESGYRAIHGTRPYSLAYGLADSPVGLLAWMLEKFHNWTDHGGIHDIESLPDTIFVDEFLTMVTIYWLTNSMSSSIRVYYEAFHEDETMSTCMGRVNIPTAIIQFLAELAKFPRDWVETSVNLQQYNEPDVGGHFPALETDQLLLDDLQRFGKLLRTKKWIN